MGPTNDTQHAGGDQLRRPDIAEIVRVNFVVKSRAVSHPIVLLAWDPWLQFIASDDVIETM